MIYFNRKFRQGNYEITSERKINKKKKIKENDKTVNKLNLENKKAIKRKFIYPKEDNMEFGEEDEIDLRRKKKVGLNKFKEIYI